MKAPFMGTAAVASNQSTMTTNTANVKGKLVSLEVSYRFKGLTADCVLGND